MKRCKVCRSAGKKLFLKGKRCFSTSCAIEKGRPSPGRHSGYVPSKPVSNWKRMVVEKRIVNSLYATETSYLKRKLREVIKANRPKEDVFNVLESRLDNVAFRAGAFVNIRSARQFINHNSVLLNGKKHNIPSTELKVGDVIELAFEVETPNEVGWCVVKANQIVITAAPFRANRNLFEGKYLVEGLLR